MNAKRRIKVLLADDDENVLECYRSALCPSATGDATDQLRTLKEELFDDPPDDNTSEQMEIVTCLQGDDAVELAGAAIKDRDPFDAVVLDIRMPPGINGVEAATKIRAMDESVRIIFVSGYSDYSTGDLGRCVPPPEQLLYFKKPIRLVELAATIRQGPVQASRH